MTTMWTDREILRLQREVADLRRDLQRLQTDLMWKESRRQFNRQIALQVFIIVVSFAVMGAMLALIVSKSR